MKRKRKDIDIKAGFWSTADRFNIVDALSLFFSVMYAAIVASIILNPDKDNLLRLQDQMNMPMLVILGGYFGDQMVSRATKYESKNTNKFDNITISNDSESSYDIDDGLGGFASEFDGYIEL